jgi:peptidyl-prolyl cis-trans isomerase SurA
MSATFSLKRTAMTALVAALMAGSMIAAAAPVAQAASSVAVIVNNSPITSGDVAKRVAFMRLQKQGGGAAEARKQLIDEALKREEISRLRVSVSMSDVDAAVGRFASGNKLSVAQLYQILDRSGVTLDHFKQYVAVAMSWPRAVNLRYGSSNNGRLSNEELVRRMQENGGQKPVTTEYFLQQVIFVVPAAKRNAILGKRQAEANASRAKFPGCEQAKVFAATMRDVSIRSLGRMMIQEIPDDWKGLVEKAGEGNTTGTRVTEKGVEYLAICKKRQVNDDLAAEVVFRAEDLGKKQQEGEDSNSIKYLDELRSKAQILNK